MPFKTDIISRALKNTYFREVLYTTERTQLVVMSIPTNTDIGKEVHNGDQILIFVAGDGQVTLNGETSNVQAQDIVVVPEGTIHIVKNTGTTDLKLYTIYAPPQDNQGTLHKTIQDAQRAEKAT